MFSIDRTSKDCIKLKLYNNGNDYEINAIARKNEITINAVIKYTYSDNNHFCGNTINNYHIGTHYIKLPKNDDHRYTIGLEAQKIFNILRSEHFPDVDKVVFEIFSIKVQDLYMEVKNNV